ncbi:ATPase [Candidatus Magnetomorum sp. HK-1]|nr:ATPase [Candidatus Magnetomorum sp. HK-1]
MFLGRQHELNLLEEHFHSSVSEFCVLYGRRRIGKSRLLEEFTKDKSSFFYLAGKENKKLQLKRFIREMGVTFDDPFVGKVNVTEWDEALTILDRNIHLEAQNNNHTKAIVVFDEFQWMCRGATELLSDLQRFWDKKWMKSGKVFLIVCGSSISFMLGEVLSQKSPLFGRRTLSFELTPFNAVDAALFLPGKTLFEIAEIYMSLGGIPKYLEIINASGFSFRKSMSRLAFSPAGYFYDEIHYVLSEQLKETENYFTLLKQMANGAKQVNELEQITRIPSGQIMYYLARLCLLGFISRHIPIGSKLGTKKVRYRLDDYFLRFYFTFIHHNRQRIVLKKDGIGFDRITKNRWDAYVGKLFEQFVRDHAEVIANKFGYKNEISCIGSFWQNPTKRKQGVQIDLVIEFIDNTTFICECKWNGNKRTGINAVTELRKRTTLYPNEKNHTIEQVLITSGGVSQSVLKEKDIRVMTLNDFF